MTAKAISDYLAAIGRRGGQAKGAAKRRSREHYVAAGKASAKARAAKRKAGK